MKKFLLKAILCVLLVGIVFSTASCGNNFTINDVREALESLEEQGKIKNVEMMDPEDWTEELNEEFEKDDEEQMDGEVLTALFADGSNGSDNMIFEFENISDAKRVAAAFPDWESGYSVRYGNIVFCGREDVIEMILDEI